MIFPETFVPDLNGQYKFRESKISQTVWGARTEAADVQFFFSFTTRLY